MTLWVKLLLEANKGFCFPGKWKQLERAESSKKKRGKGKRGGVHQFVCDSFFFGYVCVIHWSTEKEE